MTLAVDFDGVIHKYLRGWADGSIYDDPVRDAFVSLDFLMQRGPVFIHTARKPAQVARWIEKRSGYTIECTTWLPRTWYGKRKPFWNTRGLLLVTDRKYPATHYIDDRALRFSSWDQVMYDLHITA